MLKRFIVLAVPALLLVSPAQACKVVKVVNGEPQCAHTSDTGSESYTGGTPAKKSAPTNNAGGWYYSQHQHENNGYWWYKHQQYQREANQARIDAMQRRVDAFNQGRNAWRQNGTKVNGLPGTISPFVPGSNQDVAWRAERQRRGIQ